MLPKVSVHLHLDFFKILWPCNYWIHCGVWFDSFWSNDLNSCVIGLDGRICCTFVFWSQQLCQFETWNSGAKMRVLFFSTRITRLVHHSWYFHHLRLEKLWHTRCQKAIPYCQTDEEKVPHDGWHWVHLFKNICRVCPRWVSSFQIWIHCDFGASWSRILVVVDPKKKQPTWYYHPPSKMFFFFSQPNSYIEACGAFFGRGLCTNTFGHFGVVGQRAKFGWGTQGL